MALIKPERPASLAEPVACWHCGGICWFETGVHPCCEFWAATIAATGKCPSCSASRGAAFQQAERRKRH
jgi:hypothetical protein